MLITKTNPVGIDKKIDVLQRYLYSSLITKWGITEDKYNCAPRCYRNQTSDGYTAEMYAGNEYSEMYINDTVSATSFFGVNPEERIQEDGMKVAMIHLVFSVNLKEVKHSPSNQRNDEEVKLDVEGILDTFGRAHGWLLSKATTGIDKILAEYPGTRKNISLKYSDQHPNFWFRYDMVVWYQPTLKQCS